MILSESEKNRIKGLYGLMTEAETTLTPPPSESILIDKKNPFKYSQYENARKEYSKDLKNGERFYVINESKIEDDLRENIRVFGNEFLKSLNGKSFREDDNIYKINSSIVSEVDSKSNFGGGGVRSIELNPINLTINDGKPIQYTTRTWLNKDTSNFFDETKNSLNFSVGTLVFDLYFFGQLNDHIDNQNINLSWQNFINNKLKPIDFLKDDYFEIREIKRQETDF